MKEDRKGRRCDYVGFDQEGNKKFCHKFSESKDMTMVTDECRLCIEGEKADALNSLVYYLDNLNQKAHEYLMDN
jgi:hypothetical protein